MVPVSHPLRFLVVALAGWINQQQREVIDYLQTENRVLREQLGSRRLRFTDDQRIGLAAKAKCLGRRVLQQHSWPAESALNDRRERSRLGRAYRLRRDGVDRPRMCEHRSQAQQRFGPLPTSAAESFHSARIGAVDRVSGQYDVRHCGYRLTVQLGKML